MKKFHYKLRFQFIFGFILLGILICTASAFIGYFQFKNSIERKYNDTAYDVAAVAASYLEQENLKLYYDIAKNISYHQTDDRLSTILQTNEYQQICYQFESLKENMHANDIFLVYVNKDNLLSYEGTKENWYPLTYIIDSFSNDENKFVLGTQGSINPDFIDEAYQIITTGKRSYNYFISRSFHGYNTSALLPIPIEEEYLILCVEISMLWIEQSIQEYIVSAICTSIGVILIFIILYMIYFYVQAFRPLKIITEEVQCFIQDVNMKSDKLATITLKNEVGYLAQSFLKLQEDLQIYIHDLTVATKERERIDADLAIAAHIQASLLPNIDRLPQKEEYEISALMKPAKAVGGDFYDFFFVDETHLAVVIADVSGKGVPAALFMVMGKTLIREQSKGCLDLANVFTEVNYLLNESNQEGLFITAFEGILDLETGQFVYVNAGHEPPFLLKKNRSFELYSIASDFVLAGMDDTQYQMGVLKLEYGDILFEYTDGVTEATNNKNELFGTYHLREALNQLNTTKPAEIIKQVKRNIDEFVGDTPQFDDITMICLEFKGKEK